METRRTILAGTWYPATPDECEREIKSFLKEEDINRPSGKRFLGGIVPHAGWYFSGAIACNVISFLQEAQTLDALVIFGMHLHPGSPNHIMVKGAWETPFGEIEIESEMAAKLTEKFEFAEETPDSFVRDNTIEVQLPFVKYFFPDAKLVPVGVPPATKSLEVGRAAVEIAEKLGLSIKVIGSTDLTHYGVNYGFEPKGKGRNAVDWVRFENDRKVVESMIDMEPEEVIRQSLENQNACCGGAAATAIAAAKALGSKKAESLAYATSYEKNPGSSFVGYTGIVFEE